jgi:hypothetical protein
MLRHALCVSIGAALIAGGAWAAELPVKKAQAWSYDGALGELRMNPRDVYLQYVVLQLARAEGKEADAREAIETLSRTEPWRRGQPREADLFAMFTGALAVQESLQLDTMTGQGLDDVARMADRSRNTVKVADLAGPSQKSHPWEKMLAAKTATGKQPEVSPLSLCVPDDQLYLEFGSLGKLLEIVDAGDLWGAHVFNQATKSAQSQQTSDRVKQQLAIHTDPLSRPFYDMVVDEVAVTAGDLFFREGTDLTMIFALKQPAVFKPKMDGYLEAALKSRDDAVRSTGKIGEVEYVQVSTPDRAIHAFSAYPNEKLHVRSNSKAGLERVLGAIAGKSPRLGETTEFRYIRTLMERGDEREEGLVYMSDPFIRHMTSPELKLTEQRRLICYNHLRMIGHGAMLYRTQFGKKAASLQAIVAAGCAPAGFGDGAPAIHCPCGGEYSLSSDGLGGVCSHHGSAHELIPCREIALDRVTAEEAEAYRQFVEQYNRYWTRFFDPIAVRVKVSPQQYRAETIILPLIDNTVYSSMAMALGGEPEPLDALPVPNRNIFSVAMRVDKSKLLANRSSNHMLREAQSEVEELTGARLDIEKLLTKGLGNQISMNVYDGAPLFDFNLTEFMGEMVGGMRGAGMSSDIMPIGFLIASLNTPVYVAVPVKDRQVVDEFLEQLDQGLASLARRPSDSGWFPVDYDFYKMPLADRDPRVRCYAIRFGPIKWRMFFARIDDGLYIASKQSILDDLANTEPPKPGQQGPTAHAMARVRPENWDRILPAFQLGWAEASREACLNNLGPLDAIARAAAAEGNDTKSAEVRRQAEAVHGVHFFCPDGGKYELSADGRQFVCSVHGTAARPQQPAAPGPRSPMGKIMKDFAGATAELIFLEDGLHAVMTIERKK